MIDVSITDMAVARYAALLDKRELDANQPLCAAVLRKLLEERKALFARVKELEGFCADHAQKSPPHSIVETAQAMLDAIDTFMSGADLSGTQAGIADRVQKSGIFAAAAYDAHMPKSGGEAHALARAFLLALIDPLHEDLDYLRRDPEAARVARAEAAQRRESMRATIALGKECHHSARGEIVMTHIKRNSATGQFEPTGHLTIRVGNDTLTGKQIKRVGPCGE